MDTAPVDAGRLPGRTAILIVNGFDRIGLWGTRFDAEDALRYPWLELCLREVSRRSRGSDYEVLVWDNTQSAQLRAIARGFGARVFPSDEELDGAGQRPGEPVERLILNHADSLQRLWSEVDGTFEYVMTLDTDAFPIQDGWIERLKEVLRDAALAGVWRDEMSARLEPFVHPSCLITRRSVLMQMDSPFSKAGVQDVGQRITVAAQLTGHSVFGLLRSNARNAHFLIGGVYGNLVYHHAAGSRYPLFRLTEGEERDLLVYTRLRSALFEDADHVISVLLGHSDDDLGLDWKETEARPVWRWDGNEPRRAESPEEAAK